MGKEAFRLEGPATQGLAERKDLLSKEGRANGRRRCCPHFFLRALAFGVDSLPVQPVDWGPTGKAPGCLSTTGGSQIAAPPTTRSLAGLIAGVLLIEQPPGADALDTF